MNLSWSELNKNIQTELKKKKTFSQGINSLIFLRNEIFTVVENLFSDLSQNYFSLIPFPKSKGNDNATIAWSIFHLFRIEDIVCNSLIKNQQQIFFQNEYDKRLNSKIITTGNEFTNEQMIKFSKELNIKELFTYAKEVKLNSDKMILELNYESLKTKIPEERKIQLQKLNVVSSDENSFWLIDYWCNKNFLGLLQMPFSRHWIMHIDACLKIRDNQKKP